METDIFAMKSACAGRPYETVRYASLPNNHNVIMEYCLFSNLSERVVRVLTTVMVN